MSNSLWPRGLYPTGLLCPCDSPGKDTGVGSLFLLQGVFLTQGLNPHLLHFRQILYHLSYQRRARKGCPDLWVKSDFTPEENWGRFPRYWGQLFLGKLVFLRQNSFVCPGDWKRRNRCVSVCVSVCVLMEYLWKPLTISSSTRTLVGFSWLSGTFLEAFCPSAFSLWSAEDLWWQYCCTWY